MAELYDPIDEADAADRVREFCDLYPKLDGLAPSSPPLRLADLRSLVEQAAVVGDLAASDPLRWIAGREVWSCSLCTGWSSYRNTVEHAPECVFGRAQPFKDTE